MELDLYVCGAWAFQVEIAAYADVLWQRPAGCVQNIPVGWNAGSEI